MTYQYRAPCLGAQRPLEVSRRTDPGGKGPYVRWAKRALDIALVLMVSLPVLIVVLGLAAIVALDGHRPFYLQERVGRGGRMFRMLKLRSMVPGAEAVLDAYLATNPEARAEWDRDQKLRNDPRITPIGRIIRRTSLDELPQLWNVLIGDMSLVGPRPMMGCQRTLYPGTEYYRLRPGITGFWQISARNESSFCERAEFDRAYFLNLSLATDLRVLLRTVAVVVRATGH